MATEKRLIDANAFYKALYEKPLDFLDVGGDFGYFDETIENTLNEQPTVDAVEVVHGNWVYYSTTMQECSNCKRHTARHKFKYCPYCGATMGDKLHYAID